MTKTSRREFLKAAAATGAAVMVDPAHAEAVPAPSGSAAGPGAGFFDEQEREAVSELAESVLSDAARLGAVDYIEGLLTAFDHDPPRIYAGGPFSGRHPYAENGAPSKRFPEDGFAGFLPLSRIQERAWRLRLYGSEQEKHPNAHLGHATPGLRKLVKEGVQEALRLAAEQSKSVVAVWRKLPEEFRTEFSILVIEGSVGDPVYGGNRNREGWKAIHYEGDNLPLGYLLYDESTGTTKERPDAPVSTLESGPGPDPLRFWTKKLLWIGSFLTRRGLI